MPTERRPTMILAGVFNLDFLIAVQLELERAWNVDGEPDPYVFEEFERLYLAVGDEVRAAH